MRIVGLQTRPHSTQRAGIWGQRKPGHSRSLGGTFNKQGNLHRRLAFSNPKPRSPHWTITFNNTLLPQGCGLGTVASVGNGGWNVLMHSKDGEGMRSRKLLESSFQVNQLPCPLRDLLQQEYKVVQLNWKMTCLFLINLNVNLPYIIQLASCVNRKKKWN